MPVLINNKRVLPAPIVTFSKSPQLAGDGTILGAQYSLTMNGQILPNKGNPIAATGSNFSSSFSTAGWASTQDPGDDPLHGVGSSDLLISTITKLEQLRMAVTPSTGIKVEVVGFDHNQGLKFYGDLRSFQVDSEGGWARATPYTIEFGFSRFIESAGSGVFASGGSEDSLPWYIESAKDSWQFSESDKVVVNTGDWSNIKKCYEVTHSIQVKGKQTYSAVGTPTVAWQEASGYATFLFTGVMPDSFLGTTTGYFATNRKIQESVDRLDGSYSIDETFSYVPSGAIPSGWFAYEDTQINVEKTEGYITTVGIQGTILGMETNSPTGIGVTGVSRYTNASGYFATIAPTLYARARQNCGLPWLHPIPKTTSVGRMPNAGQITYSYSYDDRPPNLIPGSISEEITISDIYPGQIFSATPVIGRNQPILQYMGSRSEYKRSLSINVNMGTPLRNYNYNNVDISGYWSGVTVTGIRGLFQTKPSIARSGDFQLIFNAANPANDIGVISNKVFYEAPQESWNPRVGSYSYNISWSYEKSG